MRSVGISCVLATSVAGRSILPTVLLVWCVCCDVGVVFGCDSSANSVLCGGVMIAQSPIR